jgi:hypothetical protein
VEKGNPGEEGPCSLKAFVELSWCCQTPNITTKRWNVVGIHASIKIDQSQSYIF